MNVAIVGSNGYISSFILEEFEKITNVSITKIDKCIDNETLYLDLENTSNFNYETLNEIDYIVFTAAVSSPDKCGEDYEACYNINVTGTKLFIERAIEKKCRVLFFSSDAVFGELGDNIYNENSETNACTAYGIMKKEIEDTFKSSPYFKAMRLSYVVSKKDRFVSYCLNCIKENQCAEIFHPFYRNCICVRDVVVIVRWLCFYWDELPSSFLNATGIELVSRVRIADEINRIYGKKMKYSIMYPGVSFYKERSEITQMESLFLYELGILKEEPFTKKIQKELED